MTDFFVWFGIGISLVSSSVALSLSGINFFRVSSGFQGPPGPAGPQGPKGEQGPQGEMGLAGENGPRVVRHVIYKTCASCKTLIPRFNEQSKSESLCETCRG